MCVIRVHIIIIMIISVDVVHLVCMHVYFLLMDSLFHNRHDLYCSHSTTPSEMANSTCVPYTMGKKFSIARSSISEVPVNFLIDQT